MSGRNKRKHRTGSVEWEDLSNKNNSENTVDNSTVQEVTSEQKSEYKDSDFAPDTKDTAKQGKLKYNPLTEKQVEEKVDVGAEFKTTGDENNSGTTRIPEQEFTPPPPTLPEDEQTIQDTPYEDIKDDEDKGAAKEKPKEKDDDTGGGNRQDLPPSEKRQAAQMLADYLLQSYQTYVPKLYRMIGRVSDKKINKLEDEGKINFDILLQKRNGQKVTIRQTIQSINSKLDNSFDVTPEWIEDVRKPLERILQKKEWGITDEGYVILKVVEHNVSCVTVLISIKSEMSEYLEIAKELTMQQNNIIINTKTETLNKEEDKREQERKDNTQNQAQTFTQPPVEETQEIIETVTVQTEPPKDEGDLPPKN